MHMTVSDITSGPVVSGLGKGGAEETDSREGHQSTTNTTRSQRSFKCSVAMILAHHVRVDASNSQGTLRRRPLLGSSLGYWWDRATSVLKGRRRRGM
jgi:hypothetical protein